MGHLVCVCPNEVEKYGNSTGELFLKFQNRDERRVIAKICLISNQKFETSMLVPMKKTETVDKRVLKYL